MCNSKEGEKGDINMSNKSVKSMSHNSYISIGSERYKDLNSSRGSLIHGLNKRMRVEILNFDVKEFLRHFKRFQQAGTF